jgi:zinc/manganese transport system ATP-binding protein
MSEQGALVLDRAAASVGGREIWSELTVSIAHGEFVAVLGPNGAGKSTLLRVVLGLLAPTRGRVLTLGAPPGERNAQIGYLPQRRTFDASTRVRGCDLVRLGLDGARLGLPLPRPARLLGARERAARARVDEVIELVGAAGYARRPIGECSGGEQQRLLIAQALVRGPRMLILDEPLDSLDLPNQAQIAALVADVCASQGVTVLLVAHDVNPLLGHLSRALYLAGGHGLIGTPQEIITSEGLSRLYGVPIEVLRARDGRLVVVGAPEAHSHHGDGHPTHVVQ